MTKFNVGDKVIFNKENAHVAKQFDYKINKPYEVQEVFPFHCTVQIINEKGSSHSFDEERFELVETKLTKNQSITTLENEVAELKLIVHELREGRKTMRNVMNEVLSEPSTTNTAEDIIEFEGQQYRKVDREAREGDVVIITKEHESSNAFKINKPYKVLRGVEIRSDHPDHCYATYNVYTNATDIRTPKTVNVYELIESKPLTPNQQRAAIIEKAKKFVDEAINQGKDGSPMSELGNETYQYKFFGVEFDVNDSEVKATVYQNNNRDKRMKQEPLHVSVAKCSPNDVFNEHIGKAIALGRALGLDVSEFEQAVQPNEVVPGHIIVWNESPDEPHEVVTKNGDWFDFIYLKDNKRYNNHEYCEIERFTTILNDTNAKYEVSNNE
ncbi:hypothetical protein [Lysinibacillus capsici]|uniref:hypothetical protein n=1 Tax=Lysinibacillus capsici TaxID=2115968 RepID=UPI00289E9075|nr:hypothetical protein [Lysinibacillus capsici]